MQNFIYNAKLPIPSVHSVIFSEFWQLATPRSSRRFRRSVRQKTSFRARMCLLGVLKTKFYIWPHFLQETKNRNFRSIFGISKTINPIESKFDNQPETLICTSWVVCIDIINIRLLLFMISMVVCAVTVEKIQYGWRSPSWKSLWCHNFTADGPISTKFGRPTPLEVRCWIGKSTMQSKICG